MTPHIMTVFGTRPEAIKIAPLVLAMQASPLVRCTTVVTGQHRDMLDDVMSLFGITPDHDLDLMRHGQTLAGIAGRVLENLDPVFASSAPDVVVVQGDTTSTVAAALGAFYRRIPVVHLEAGLRSHDTGAPFPEEVNRKVTSQVASLHLAPTQANRTNLLREGVAGGSIVVTGNTVIDALRHVASNKHPFTDPRLEDVVRSGRRIVLVTSHRRENWGKGMDRIGRSLARIARTEPEVVVVLPVHRNPVVRESVLPHLDGLGNVVVTEPLRYSELARLLRLSTLVLTDSGGLQEEAPSLGKPVLVMRDTTERSEALDAGTVRLVGTAEHRIVTEVERLLHDAAHYRSMASAVNPYGDGAAAERCLQALLDFSARRRGADAEGTVDG